MPEATLLLVMTMKVVVPLIYCYSTAIAVDIVFLLISFPSAKCLG